MRKSKLSWYKQSRLIELFVAGSTARTAASEPPQDCRILNAPREYDNENTKLYPRNERASRPYAN